MISSVIISLAVSFLFLNGNPAILKAQANENIAKAPIIDSGRVLSAVENLAVLPSQTYVSLYPEYNLPVNPDKIARPVRLSEATDISLYASSSMAIDKRTGAVLWENNSNELRPLASITKLMTALVFLSTNPKWDSTYQLEKEDVRAGGRSYIYPGDTVTVKDLFYLTLVGSDNTAAVALAKATGFSEPEFAKKMNEQARQYRLEKTFFRDVSGLSEQNVSTAKEVLNIARISLAKKEIREATLNSEYSFATALGRKVIVYTTDYLVTSFPTDGIDIMGGKTGHTDEAGYCFVGNFKNESGTEIFSVVMGTPSNEDRFGETKKLVKWAYSNYKWKISAN